MGVVIRIVGYGVVLCLIGASAIVNFAYGTTLSPGNLGMAFGLVFFLLDILKSLAPVRASAFFSHGEWAKGIAAWAISLALSGLALTSGHALYLKTVGEGEGDITQAQERYRLAKDEKNRLEGELAGIGKTRLASLIEADITAKKLDSKYNRSKSCANATLDDSRAFCQELSRLEGELASAKQAETLSGKLQEASAKLSGLDISKANQSTNVQGALSGWLAIFIPILLELGCVFGLWLMEAPEKASQKPAGASQTAETGFGPITQPSGIQATVESSFEPTDTIAKWAESTLKRKAGSDILAADLYPIYEAYCEREGFEALSKNMLGRKLKGLGFATNKRGGKARYANVALKARGSKPRLVA
jgi:hypothetical protein